MPYSSTALQVTPIVQNTDMNVDATSVFLTNTMHFQPEASYQWVHQHTGLHCKISCLNSGYLPRQGEIKLHIHHERRLDIDAMVTCMFPTLLHDFMMNVL